MHDVSVPAAVLAGLISFLSPCVLPLVPPYLVYLTGATIEHVANDETAQASPRGAPAILPVRSAISSRRRNSGSLTRHHR